MVELPNHALPAPRGVIGSGQRHLHQQHGVLRQPDYANA
jgi:hypothetical protein